MIQELMLRTNKKFISVTFKGDLSPLIWYE